MPSQTVYIVDDDEAVRDSLVMLLTSMGMAAVPFESAEAFLESAQKSPDQLSGCCVLDVRMPGMSGIEIQNKLGSLGINLPCIMVSGFGDVPSTVDSFKAGAVDFLEKPFNEQQLLDRVQAALLWDAEQRAYTEKLAEISMRYNRLTPRERQVMELVVEGKLNKQIAGELGLSHKTIEVHRAHVMDKMQADSLAHLVRMAMMLKQKEYRVFHPPIRPRLN
ncbi:Transcriptional regulatory protein FixJ [Poriferisphaera corsica]|uniref:Transcriptional regulatory protein FixJ n=1 Tax=Poriferisphaera corsica TaxID=2528020 RepID=A0A517YUB5_9BACT|nr:response regulator transcription factor [Poriferisphaera corsica]QDU33820.1 Transcriptional regulatory protein FixJ [Poriferisphaera corsica]